MTPEIEPTERLPQSESRWLFFAAILAAVVVGFFVALFQPPVWAPPIAIVFVAYIAFCAIRRLLRADKSCG